MSRCCNLCRLIGLLFILTKFYLLSAKDECECPCPCREPEVHDEPHDDEHDEELLGDGYEGDMELSRTQINLLTQKMPPYQLRNALLSLEYRWPNQTLPYKISSKFKNRPRKKILRAMERIAAKSCIRFVPAKKTDKAYIRIFPRPRGCSTAVGYRRQIRKMKLARGCMRIGIIQHELLHALGFFHQHSESDRDDYVTVNLHNVAKRYKKDFRKYENNIVGDFGVAYDYGSVMHYNKYTFSKNGEPTLMPKVNNVTIGQRKGLSKGDFQKLNRMYNCKK